jgi:hypothetical protein
MPDLLLCDPCFWIYLAIVVVCFYGLALFAWWWYKVGHASEVYIYFMVLLASEAFYNMFNALARYTRFSGKDLSEFLWVLDSPAWEFRALFHLMILSVIIGRMTLRAITTLRKVKRFKLEDLKDVPGSNR